MASKKGDIFVATESFVANVDGEDIHVARGRTLVLAGHPLLKGRDDLFEPVKVHFDFIEVAKDVEAATAAPGEKLGE